MKDIIRNNKALLIVLSGAIIIMLLIIVPFMIFGEKNEKAKDKYFPNYTKIKVDKKTFTDEEKKQNLEKTMSQDNMFQKIVMIDDYDSNNMTRKDLENIIVNYAKIFEKSNTKYLSKYDYKYACMKEKYFVESYDELYNIDISSYLKDMTYYYKNIFKKKKKDSIKDNIIEVKEEIQNELPNVIESVTETKIFESKKSKTKRIVLKSLGILFIMILLFIWLWLTVILMASMFAILDGIKFYGINITILGIDILLLLMIILVNKKILNKKINSKLTFISLIVLLIIIAFGITLSIKQISKVETVKDVSDKYTMTRKYEKINLSSNLEKITYISFNANYDTKYIIEYDNTLDNKLTIETKYYESYYDYYIKQNSNDVYVSLSVDYRDRLSVYLENLKDKKIYDKNELSRYIVKITMNERDKDRVVIEN